MCCKKLFGIIRVDDCRRFKCNIEVKHVSSTYFIKYEMKFKNKMHL